MTAIDIQLSAAHLEWAVLREASLAAEARGFEALYVFDHLAGTALGGDTMLECFSWLGALAELTSSIELGALVTNVWNRQVGTLVTAVASIALISGRRFHFGIGAGTSPSSRWADEQRAVAAHIAPTLDERHARVEAVLEMTDRLWSLDREEAHRTFPVPSIPPLRIVGVNSVRLSRLAGRRADGINVAWANPRLDEFLSAATVEATTRNRSCTRTVWAHYDAALLDPDHPERQAMAARGIDRLILTVLGDPEFA